VLKKLVLNIVRVIYLGFVQKRGRKEGKEISTARSARALLSTTVRLTFLHSTHSTSDVDCNNGANTAAKNVI
jgi:hypothetical protein